MAIKGASFEAFPDGQTVFGLGNGNLLQPVPIADGYEACPANAATVFDVPKSTPSRKAAAVMQLPKAQGRPTRR